MSANLTIPAEFAEIAAICVASEMTIGGKVVLGVEGRALHEGLKVGRAFRAWMPGRIEEFGFVEGQDFETYDGLSRPNPDASKSRPQKTKEYRLTLDMAKELSMVENNEKGRLARRYFIWREQQALSIQPSVSVAQMEQRIMQSLGGMMKGILNKQVTPKIEQLSQKVDGVLAVRPIGVAVTTSRTALGWLEHYGVVKRKKGMSHKVSNALKRLSFQMGYVISKTSEEKKLCFHEIVANAYFTVGAGRHLLPKAVKGQKEMGLESTPAPFSQTPA
ncbi:MAG: antA/AntB antirepressor family protein [Acetobacter papayae]|uniref:antA/AntB antirepressor family protein n=1 Tax=Acetobacter papayae TaxID=1076592 RepID=UPI0039ED7E18